MFCLRIRSRFFLIKLQQRFFFVREKQSFEILTSFVRFKFCFIPADNVSTVFVLKANQPGIFSFGYSNKTPCVVWKLSTIQTLFASGRPFVILWWITFVVVTPFKRVFGRRFKTHVFSEVFEMKPPFTNFDPSSTIVFVIRVVRICATRKHVRPCRVQRVVGNFYWIDKFVSRVICSVLRGLFWFRWFHF